MQCRRCPHFVRHGKAGADGKSIEFRDLCGLKLKSSPQSGEDAQSCANYPFSDGFDYMGCNVYVDTFKSSVRKNDVQPTQDFKFTEALGGASITDMELL